MQRETMNNFFLKKASTIFFGTPKSYEQIFITNVPSFYKINLYNRINERYPIFVAFTDGMDSTRNADFYKGRMSFNYVNLGGRNLLSKIFFLLKIVLLSKYNTMVLGGWDTFLSWICALLSPRRKNALALESSILESNTGGIKGFFKRIFLSRISRVYAAGQLHRKLLDALGYRGDVVITHGVGIYNVVETPPFKPRGEVKNFLYVGRFIPCKNLVNLVKAFEKVNGVKVPYKIEARRPGDIAECWADPAKAKELLGWTAQKNLEDMCRDAWRWQTQNPNGYAD